MITRFWSRVSLAWADLPLRTKGTVIVLIPVAALLGTATWSFVSGQQYQHAESGLRHVQATRIAARTARGLLQDAEAAVQGYLLSGQEALLIPYQKAVDTLPQALTDLTLLSEDIPNTRQHMRQITSLAEGELGYLAELRGAAALPGKGSPARAELLAKSKKTMDALRRELEALTDNEAQLLAELLARLTWVREQIAGALVLSVLVGISFGVLAIALFVGGISQRVKVLEDNASRLARMLPLTPLPPGNDEIGRLGRALGESGRLLVKHEQQLQQAIGETSRASRAKSEFISRMSHELRTPLNAVIGFAELMLERTVGDLTAKQDEFLRDIRDSGTHLLALINDILDISKIEAGRMELTCASTEFAIVVDEALTTLRPQIDRKHLQVTTTLDPTATEVWADGIRLKQILHNLLSNAVKFTPTGGQIRVESRRINQELELAVVDTGPGIAPEDQAKLFQEFTQLENARQAAQPGTGLGLALVKRLVELHGGHVWVESTVGIGSRFIVRLPLRAPEEQAKDGPGPILVVEDDLATQRLFTHYLREAGYRTAVIADGREVVDKVKALRPLVICLDIRLPGVEDWEVLRRLKEDPETAAIPIVVPTVVDDPQAAFELGATSFLLKPVGRDALVHAVASALRTGPEVTPTVLVVDDDPSVLAVIPPTLETSGYRVLTASGGLEAVREAQQHLPHLIILDLLMPDLTGFEVIAILRGDVRTRGIPIIVQTAKDLTSDERAFLNERVQGIKVKGPMAPQQLVTELRRILATRTQFPQ